jgi:hypothetical protein
VSVVSLTVCAQAGATCSDASSIPEGAGAIADVAELKHAIDAGDDGTMGRLLGFPDCCIAFFRKTWVDEGCVDTTWAMAANGGRADDTGQPIEIDADTPFQAIIH